MDLEKILGLTDSEKIKMYLAYKDVEEEEKRTVKRTGKKNMENHSNYWEGRI